MNIFHTDYTNEDDVLLYGDFWIDNYKIDGDTLKTAADSMRALRRSSASSMRSSPRGTATKKRERSSGESRYLIMST